MWVVTGDRDVLEAVIEDGLCLGQPKLRVRAGFAGKLLLDLLNVNVIDVAVPARSNELADLETGLLGEHVGQQ